MTIQAIPSLEDLGQAISRIKDAQLRISRHKDFAHKGKFANGLTLINATLGHALENLTGLNG